MTTAENADARLLLTRLWWAGVDAVRGDRCTQTALEEAKLHKPDTIIAVGKAACAMAVAAYDHFDDNTPGLIVTKYGHAQDVELPPSAEVIESAHPVPDAQSLIAGQQLIEMVEKQPPGSHLLFLVSGGASALAEAPIDGLTLDDIIAKNTQLLASGQDIHAMNKSRIETSQIKGGKLLARFRGSHVTVMAMSDVEGDAMGIIGSGIGDLPKGCSFTGTAQIVASNAIARAAVAQKAQELGVEVCLNEETLYEKVEEVAPRIGAALKAGSHGLYIWGGEPTVRLPENPGRGGRNQALALTVAREIVGDDNTVALVAGTDGSDGPTQDAGGFADGVLWGRRAAEALAAADSGTYLAAHDALFTCGPTGTNVMDLALALKT